MVDTCSGPRRRRVLRAAAAAGAQGRGGRRSGPRRRVLRAAAAGAQGRGGRRSGPQRRVVRAAAATDAYDRGGGGCSGPRRRRVPGLIDRQFRAVRQADRGQEPPALVGNISRHFDSLVPQVRQRGVDVIAREVKLMAACTVSWMNGELGGRQGENEPAPPASTDDRPSTSRKNARTCSASGEKTIACMPVITL